MHEGVAHNTGGIYDLGFGDIYGGFTGGGENLGNVIQSILSVLTTGGYFGEEYQSGGEKYGEDIPGSQLVTGQAGWFGGGDAYNIDKLIGWLESFAGEDALMGTDATNVQTGMCHLLKLLNRFQSEDIIGGYRQDVAGVGAEIGSQTSLLKKTLTTKDKGGRYGALGTGGKLKGGGGRQDYLSDYYGLQEKQGEMTTGLQTGVEEDVNKLIMDYMGMFPA